MAITVDHRNSGGTCATGGSGATISDTITIGSLSSGILLAFYQSYDGTGFVETHPATVVLDAAGVNRSLTPVSQAVQAFLSNSFKFVADIWYLLNPPALTAKQLLATWSAGAIVGASGSASYDGVAQTSTFNAASPQRANGSSTSISLAVTSATGEMVVDSVVSFNPSSLTVGGSQTQIANHTNTLKMGSSDQAGAGTATMAWTLGSSAEWLSTAVSIKPAGGGSPTLNDANYHGGGRGMLGGMRRGLSYHSHPQISVAAYYRERARAQREFIRKIQRAA